MERRRPFTPDQDRPGPYLSAGDDHPLGIRLAGSPERIMDLDLAAIRAKYDRAARVHRAGGASGWGTLLAEDRWMQFRAAFPTGRFAAGQPGRAAVLWSLTDVHDGYAQLGSPPGAEVHVMGFTHAEFGSWGLHREWSPGDEVAIRKQSLMQVPDSA